jgi:hypothetical protein
MNLKDRIATLEQRHTPPNPEIILITGGLGAFDDTRAEVGADRMHRDTAEPFPAFKARAFAQAKATGAGFVIIGGLPNQGVL